MPAPLQIIVGCLYLTALLGLFIYGINAYVMLILEAWTRRRAAAVPPPPPPAVWPAVTVQMPLYNERYVARRLLEAVGRLQYPPDRLEIQILDDSTDDTTAILAAAAVELRGRGLRVAHLTRSERRGFKAGALEAGLKEASGEFIAVFDADFMPPPDFLLKTIPSFVDPDVAVVQARWGHLNRDFSLLTMAQSLGIDGHFAVEQPARCRANLLLNFNGTAGVWRTAAIHDAGGWTHDTLTEDLDLSYRAQLRGWRIVYLRDLVCPAEIPVVITGFKSQQRRWARGSIETALKLLPTVLRAPLPLWTRYQAFVHLTYYMIHPLMLTVVLMSVPLLGLDEFQPPPPILVATSLTFALAALGPGSMLLHAQRVLDPAWLRRIWRLPTIMIIGVGVAWSTSLAVAAAFGGRRSEFVRTPKFGIDGHGGHWKGKGYMPRRPWGGVIELGLGAYCVWTTWTFWHHGQYSVLPFLLLYATGFLTVGTLTIVHTTIGARGATIGARGATSAAHDAASAARGAPSGARATTMGAPGVTVSGRDAAIDPRDAAARAQRR
jgi:cellulose synthase/poly-beta-1,6-N-acetylglucosamine synthase-like glycosyltransferase